MFARRGREVLVIAWIVAALAVFVVQTMIPATIRYLLAGPGTIQRLRIALGPRDEQPALSIVGGRAARALANMQEALPVFLTLAFLHVVRASDDGLAIAGAAIFVAARSAYVPAYLAGWPGVRSAIWVASWCGLGAMTVSFVH
jgi:uncharacterized MAPEG superfamily protein